MERKKSFMNPSQKSQRNAIQVMLGLIGMVQPLLGIMLVAIFMGCIGNLMATFITILGGVGIGGGFGLFYRNKIGNCIFFNYFIRYIPWNFEICRASK